MESNCGTSGKSDLMGVFIAPFEGFVDVDDLGVCAIGNGKRGWGVPSFGMALPFQEVSGAVVAGIQIVAKCAIRTSMKDYIISLGKFIMKTGM